MNTSKRGITLDLTRPRGCELLLALAARADVVLETGPTPGLGWPELHAQNPRLVHVALTPFGETGPRAGWRGSDLTMTAMSGNLYSTGDPDRAPVRCSLPVSYYHGGIEAAVGVAFALLARERTGEGQHVDVALQEAMVMPNIGTAAMFKMTGNRGARAGAFMRQEKSVAREFFVEVENPGRGRLRYPGAFARSNATAIGIRRPAPRLGEHTAEVLGELGLGAAELERLRAEGVV